MAWMRGLFVRMNQSKSNFVVLDGRTHHAAFCSLVYTPGGVEHEERQEDEHEGVGPALRYKRHETQRIGWNARQSSTTQFWPKNIQALLTHVRQPVKAVAEQGQPDRHADPHRDPRRAIHLHLREQAFDRAVVKKGVLNTGMCTCMLRARHPATFNRTTITSHAPAIIQKQPRPYCTLQSAKKSTRMRQASSG